MLSPVDLKIKANPDTEYQDQRSFWVDNFLKFILYFSISQNEIDNK